MKKVWLKVIAAIVVAITCFIGGRAYQANENANEWHFDYKKAWQASHYEAYCQFVLLQKCMNNNKSYWKDSIMSSEEYHNWEKSVNGDFEDFYCYE